ncbi:MAG: class I SAM-dependent methyltransferase [Alphaproteobacteria bacterium]
MIDLGSGNGLFTREIARALPEAKVVGIEISAKSYTWSRMLKNFYRLENLDYKKSDFFSFDLSGTDAVVFYLTLYEIGRIGKKLRQELKPGAIAISNRFALKAGWEPAESSEVKTLYPLQKTFYLYKSVKT